jgi:DNA-binding transcriptional LysR family regulator
MQDVHLRQLDLNLLVVLQALLAERSVTRAADRLALSQPAVSHALARLRRVFDDRLLVRTPHGMEPTPRARAMAEPLDRALADLGRAVSSAGTFDPRRTRRRFNVATDDYVELILLPKLLRRLWSEAPAIEVRILGVGTRSGHDLAEGHVDLVIDPVEVLGQLPGAYSQRVLDERFVCVARAGHPALARPLTVKAFAALSHALVAPAGRPGGIVDTALGKLGLRRRVAITIPHFIAAPAIIRETDVIATLPERIARTLGNGLALFEPPLKLRPFTIETVWHERNHTDPAHTWFRGVVAAVARSL